MSDKSTPNDAGASGAIGEIHHGPSQAEIFFEKNLKLLILGLLLLVVGVAVFVITSQLGKAKTQEAGSALVSAESPEALRKVMTDYPDSPSALSAQMILAEQLWQEGKEEEALKTYRAVESSPEDHPAVANARFALATVEHQKGRLAEAEALFQKILSDENAKYLHPLSLVALGNLAKAAGDDEKAESYYSRKLNDYGDYFDGGYAITRSNLVGVDLPEKVGPPPAPEPVQPGSQPGFPSLGTSSPAIIPTNEATENTEDVPKEEMETEGETTNDPAEDQPTESDLPPGLELEDAEEPDSEVKNPAENASEMEDAQTPTPSE